jgi:hypothetical protein
VLETLPYEACLLSVVVPKSGGAAVPYLAACFADPISLDGGAVYSSPATGNLYAAYLTTPGNIVDGSGGIAVFKNFTEMATKPFGSGVIGHPVFIPHATVPTLVVPDNTGTFWVARLDESVGLWSKTKIGTATGYQTMDHTSLLRNGTRIVDGLYGGDIYQTGRGIDQMIFFYPKGGVGTPQPATRLQGVFCSFGGLVICSTPSSWITDASNNALFPTVAIAKVGTSDIRPTLTYLTEMAHSTNGPQDGSLAMAVARISLATNAIATTVDTKANQIPCPDKNHTIGDYDGMVVVSNGSSLPILARFFTDSTGATTCDPVGRPEHVSVYLTLP